VLLRGGPQRVHKTNYSSKIASIGAAMDYQDYVRLASQISQLMASNKLKEAIDALYQLILSDISDVDKAAMCINLATVYDRLGNTEEALTWYDKGIAYEQEYCRYDVPEKKAQYLSQLGKNNEAVLIYEGLIKEHFVSESDKERMRKTIQAFLGKAKYGWQ
jgi:tetratricopeptide (TPR) repeat protein